MRILLLNYEFPPLGGGAGNANYYLLKEFAKKADLQIDVVTSSIGGFKKEQFAPGITIHFLDIGKKNNPHFQTIRDLLTYSWKAYFYCKKLIRNTRYDFCHAFFGIPCGYIAMKLGIPYIVSLRGSDVPFYSDRFFLLDLLFFRRISRNIWGRAKSVTAVSHYLRELAEETSPDQAIEVIFNGIDIEEFQPTDKANTDEKTFTILFVGRLIERKGLKYALAALKELVKKYPNVRLLIVGDGPQRNTHEHYVDKHRLSPFVHFLGPLNREQTRDHYQKSDVFLLPSIKEALPNVILEAMACGLPIICTETGAAELINKNGIIIAKESSGDIKEALVTLMSDKKLRRNMARQSRLLVKDKSWDEVANLYLRLYEKVVTI